MKTTILALLLTTLASIAYAEEFDGVLEKALHLLESGKYDEGVEFIYSTNKWVDSSSDAVINTKNHLKSMSRLIGEFRYREKLAETWMGTRYVHLVYAFGYDRQPIRIQFALYNPTGEKWVFNSFSFDSNLTDGLELFTNNNLFENKP
jgi:hypothetical protein